jgi:hypothetical protein
MKRIKSFAQFINEGLNELDYNSLGQNEMNGDALSSGESKKFHKLLTDKVESQTEFQYSESNDDDTEHYYINSNNDEIGISIVQKGNMYFWKTVVSDKKLQDGSVIDNGSDRNLNNVIDDIFEFIMSVDDLSRNA